MASDLARRRAHLAAFAALDAESRRILLRARLEADDLATIRRDAERPYRDPGPLSVLQTLGADGASAARLADLLDAALAPRTELSWPARRRLLVDRLIRHSWRRPFAPTWRDRLALAALRLARRMLPLPGAGLLLAPLFVAAVRRVLGFLLLARHGDAAVERAFLDGRYGFRHAYRLLQPAATTAAAAEKGRAALAAFIAACAVDVESDDAPELSIGLSPLYPFAGDTDGMAARVTMAGLLRPLIEDAAAQGFRVVFDAEPDVPLLFRIDLLENLLRDPALAPATMGLAIDAREAGALPAAEYLLSLAQATARRLVMRLVDADTATEPHPKSEDPADLARLSWHATARALLAGRPHILPVIATHAPARLAWLRRTAGNDAGYEVMSLHGHARTLYRPIAAAREAPLVCRIHAPVGTPADARRYLRARIAALRTRS